METLRYELFGLAIDSEIPLPELKAQPAADGSGNTDLSIRLGLPAGEEDGGYVIDIEGVARFTIRGGTAIRVTPAEGAGEREVRLFLLGSAMGAALHQRGILPLHANAVEIDGRAVAFMGQSGAGKSTLAAWFHDQGHPILADDVCVIRADAGGTALAYPGLPRLRLWEDALEASGRVPADHSPSFRHDEGARRKFDVPIPVGSVASRPLPLAALFQLVQGPELRIERLTGSRAVEAISANTYRGRLIAEVGDSNAHVAACLAIARHIPVFTLERPFDRAGFDSQCAAVLHYCRSRLPSG